MNVHDKLTRRDASIQAPTQASKRNIVILASTGQDVLRSNPWGEKFIERLQVTDAAVNLDFLNSGKAPLLDSHNQFEIDGVLGTISAARITPLGLVVEATFPPAGTSQKIDEAVAAIKAGTLNNVSVGYKIDRLEISEENGVEVRTATGWSPMEVSIVPLPADLATGIIQRSANEKDLKMTLQTQQSGANVGKTDFIRRAREIGTQARINGDDVLDLMERSENNLDTFRKHVIDHLSVRDEKINVSSVHSHGMMGLLDGQRIAMVEALVARATPGATVKGEAQAFAGMSMLEMATRCLENNGQRVGRMMPKTELISRAMTTSDFPNLLTLAGNKFLADSYALATSVLKQLSTERGLNDFRPASRLQIDDAGFKLEERGEGGEFRHGYLSESKSTIQLKTAGKIIALSREAMINDDLGALSDPSKFSGRAVGNYEADKFVALLSANGNLGVKMEDGKNLFHVDHGNLGAAGGLTIDNVSAARLAMRNQRSADGNLIAAAPSFLVVGSELETTAEKLVASISPISIDGVNPFTKLTALTEPRIGGKGWYLVAPAAQVEGLEYGCLAGQTGPRLESEWQFKTDTLEFKTAHDFATGFADWRGWYYVPSL